MSRFSRREFLALGAAGLVGTASGVVRVWLAPAALASGHAGPTGTLSPTATPQVPFPAQALPLPLWITATEDLFAVQYDRVPLVSLETWSLTVHGMVRNELHLGLDELRALPATTCMHTIECIGNAAGGPLIGNANWRGVRLRDLLERAGVEPGATRVTLGGVDEYFTSVPLARAMHQQALLAYDLNGQPLPLNHGFPLRALLPGVYGQKQPKWITGIKVTDQEDLGPWEQKGWSREAPIQLHSAVRVPPRDSTVPRGDVILAGVALASEIGVRAVEVSTDGGQTWNETVLTRGPSASVWTPWGYIFRNPAPGEYAVADASDG